MLSDGLFHPIVASELFMQPIDGVGGLFNERRRALMRGTHPRQHNPHPDKLYIATIDVGGQDEAATDALAQLDNPARDFTCCTIFAIDTSQAYTGGDPGPTCRAVDVFIDHGSRHFQTIPGRPSLAERLNAYLNHWGVIWTICDQSGVGEGLTDWLTAKRSGRVTGYQLHPINKAALGNNFLAMIETGRFLYWSDDEQMPQSDGWWFWQQAQSCRYEVKPDGRFERDLRWGVPTNHRTDTPTGFQPTHDDRLISAALISCIDELYREGIIILGTAKSAIIKATDPLEDMEF